MSKEELSESLASMGYFSADQCLNDLDVRFTKYDRKLRDLANGLDELAKQFEAVNSNIQLLADELYKILNDIKSN